LAPVFPALSTCYALWPGRDMVAAFAVAGGSPGDEA